MTEPVEALLSDIAVERAERIVEAERRLGAELVLEGADAVAVLAAGVGAKEAEEPTRAARMTDFMIGQGTDRFSVVQGRVQGL